jgi:hypothetical protein
MTKGVKNSNGGLVLSDSGEAMATGIDEVNVAPLRKTGAPGFKLALTANTDVSDATVVNNTIAGLMSTYNGNYATSFSATPAA